MRWHFSAVYNKIKNRFDISDSLGNFRMDIPPCEFFQRFACVDKSGNPVSAIVDIHIINHIKERKFVKNIDFKKDFSISCDTVYWTIIAIMLFGIVVSYKLGFDSGVKTEKIGWLEDKRLEALNERK